jgi:hypothetical protein
VFQLNNSHPFGAIFSPQIHCGPIMSVNPVFFDESGRRWRVVKCLLVGMLIVLVSVPASFVISALTIRSVPQVFENPNPPSTDATPTIMFGRAASKSRMR